MTEAHFEVNGKAEDERGRSGAGVRRWSAWHTLAADAAHTTLMVLEFQRRCWAQAGVE